MDVMGSLPQVSQWTGTKALAPVGSSAVEGHTSHLSAYEEAIRSLRNSILLKDFDRRVRTLMLTSTTPSEGKSTVATHLAVAHAQQLHKTLLIDGDLRRPTVHQRFGVENKRGLSDAMLDGADWRQLLTPVPRSESLDVLTAGPASPRKAADFLGNLDDATVLHTVILALAELLEGIGGAILSPHSQSTSSVFHTVRILKERGELHLLKGIDRKSTRLNSSHRT